MTNAPMRLFLVVVMLSFPSFALAHGKAEHILGTVTAVTDDQIVIKTVKGTTATLGLRPSTTFTARGSANSGRPQVGDRLVADVTKKGTRPGEDWVAVSITFGTPKHRSPH